MGRCVVHDLDDREFFADFFKGGQRLFQIVLAVRGRSVTSYIDGALVNRVTLQEDPEGPIGLALWGRQSEVRFRDHKIRHYYRAQSHH